METNEEIWRAAYNAALTGYLGSGHNDIQDVTRSCDAHANAALKAHKVKWPEAEGTRERSAAEKSSVNPP